jgi:hypothetical protein
LLTDALTIHFVELPKIPRDLAPSADADPVLKWAWFFKANNDEERHAVAMSDPTLRDAEAALLHLSDDPIAREYAYRRELELIHFQNQLERKREEATVASIETVCRACGIELDDKRRVQLTKLDFDALQRVLSRIVETREWPTTQT